MNDPEQNLLSSLLTQIDVLFSVTPVTKTDFHFRLSIVNTC